MRIGNKLEVIYKGDIKAGILWVDDDGFHFEYDDAFIEDDTMRPISVNMSKTKKLIIPKSYFTISNPFLARARIVNKFAKHYVLILAMIGAYWH